MPKSKFFRVAVEGQTTDGRVIERNWLEEMAASYNPATYGARVNMEHIRGYSAEPPFNAYGDVLALKTETIEIELDGKKVNKLALFAQIDPTDTLVTLNQNRQKLYTSCEIAPSFADTGKAYLVGLAVTDNPASLGTEMLAFAAGQEHSPLAGRKQDAKNLFSSANDTLFTLEIEPDEQDDVKGLVALATDFFKRFSKTPEPLTPPASTTPPPPSNDNVAQDLAALAPIVQQLAVSAEATNKAVTALTGRVGEVDELKTQMAELSAKLDGIPEQTTTRPLATGTNGYAKTDC